MNSVLKKGKGRRTKAKQREEREGDPGEKERGVHVSCSANKQKVNTGEGNTVTLDAAERILSLPTQVSQKAILPATGQRQREKSQHLSPPEALGDKGRREKSDATPFVCRDLNMLPFFALPSTFFFFPRRSSPMVTPPRKNTKQAAKSPSPLLAARKKNVVFFFSYRVASLAG